MTDRAGDASPDAAMIAEMLAVAPSSVSRALAGAGLPRASRAVAAVLAAWEIMTPEQRLTWLAALGVPAERPRRGRPRKPPA